MTFLYKENKLFFILFLVLTIAGLVGVIAQIVSSYTPELPTLTVNYGRTFLTFTFLSNVLVVVTAALTIGLRKWESRAMNTLRIVATAAITITLVVYWALLSSGLGSGDVFGIFTNLMVHAVTPVLMIILFIAFAIFGNFKNYVKYWISLTIFVVIAVVYIIIGVSYYYGFNQVSEAALYPFFDFNGSSTTTIIITLLGICLGAAILVSMYTAFFNFANKLNKNLLV